MAIDIDKLREAYPKYISWPEKVFNDPLIIEEVNKYNEFVSLGNDNNYHLDQFVRRWCTQYVGEQDKDWRYLAMNMWLFKNKEDAILFKMTWR